MAAKGIDLSHHAAKSIGQPPEREQHQVVVALGEAARDALPTQPGKTICFTWSIPDPAEAQGALDHARPAFESAFQALTPQLRELVGAVLQEPHLEEKL
jgi:protein-tyrosine-phosphatase